MDELTAFVVSDSNCHTNFKTLNWHRRSLEFWKIHNGGVHSLRSLFMTTIDYNQFCWSAKMPTTSSSKTSAKTSRPSQFAMYNVSHGQATNNSWGDKHIHSVFLSFNEQHFCCLEDFCMHSCHKGSTQPKLVIFNLSKTSVAALYSSIM